MTMIATTLAKFDLTEIQIQFIVDHDDIARRYLEEITQLSDGGSGQIHEAAWLGHDQPGQLRDLRIGALMHAEIGMGAADEFISDLKADVVAGTGIVRSGITKAYDKKRSVIHTPSQPRRTPVANLGRGGVRVAPKACLRGHLRGLADDACPNSHAMRIGYVGVAMRKGSVDKQKQAPSRRTVVMIVH